MRGLLCIGSVVAKDFDSLLGYWKRWLRTRRTAVVDGRILVVIIRLGCERLKRIGAEYSDRWRWVPFAAICWCCMHTKRKSHYKNKGLLKPRWTRSGPTIRYILWADTFEGDVVKSGRRGLANDVNLDVSLRRHRRSLLAKRRRGCRPASLIYVMDKPWVLLLDTNDWFLLLLLLLELDFPYVRLRKLLLVNSFRWIFLYNGRVRSIEMCPILRFNQLFIWKSNNPLPFPQALSALSSKRVSRPGQ